MRRLDPTEAFSAPGLRDLVLGGRRPRMVRDPLVAAMIYVGLLNRSFFTKPRTKGRRQNYADALRAVTPEQRREAIERWGRP